MRRSPNGWIVAGACPPEQATLAKEGSLRRASHFGEAALFRRKAPGQAANEVSAAFRAPQARGTSGVCCRRAAQRVAGKHHPFVRCLFRVLCGPRFDLEKAHDRRFKLLRLGSGKCPQLVEG